MRIMIIGSGGREHALAWKIAQSPLASEIITTPGNAGTASLGTNLPIAETDTDAIDRLAKERRIDLVIVGPENPLANGLADRLQRSGIPTFGPTQAAAQLESSKSFARKVMDEAGVPSPLYHTFQDAQEAIRFVKRYDKPTAVKADGLAGGKGVSMCPNSDQAVEAIKASMQERIFGTAGETVVVEEWLEGPEISAFGFTDGADISNLVAATDYKRARNGGTGPNTGGMGSHSPPDLWNDDLSRTIREKFMLPVIRAMAERATPYQGILYCGLIITNDGPKVLEFNCRFGDPETQVIIPQLITDPIEVMMACATGNLAKSQPIEWSGRPTVGVVIASSEYPEPSRNGHTIAVPDNLEPQNGLIFLGSAGYDQHTKKMITTGGRVMTCVGNGDSIHQASRTAYSIAEQIIFHGAKYRTDIGIHQRQNSPPTNTQWPPTT